MNIPIKKRNCLLITALAVSALLALPGRVLNAQEKLTILFTSNLGGKFNLDLPEQEKTDPMVLAAQSVMHEADRGHTLFMDLGNAFYPGVLSKYSYGAVVMDFFNYTACKTSLVSSKDLRLGVESLEFLQKESFTKLLAANIMRDDRPVFQPYIIEKTKNHSVAFVGLASKKVLFDVAEKQLYGIAVANEKDVMKKTIAELKEKSVSHIVLLSGLEYTENMDLLNSFPEISCVIAGGDNKGQALNGHIVYVDTDDGRSILTVPPGKGYCLLSLVLDNNAWVSGFDFRPFAQHRIETQKYKAFLNRVTLWKKQFLQETDKEIINTGGKNLAIDQERMANLLRDKYGAEMALLGKDAVIPFSREGSVSYLDLLSAVNDNFTLYTMRLAGSDLLELKKSLKGQYITGIDDRNTVQGYVVQPKRSYSIVVSQGGYEEIKGILGRDLPHTNTWDTLLDAAVEDLSGRKVLLKDDYKYLDRRFYFLTDIMISLYYDRAAISRTDETPLPVGEPDRSYYKWGIEGKLDFTLYNNLHKFVLIPYINYSRQNKDVQNNLLRSTFLYEINLSRVVSPYHKLMVDTVVTPVADAQEMQLYGYSSKDHRPVHLLQTLGAVITVMRVSGKIGAGYEKSVHDPVEPMVFGFEFGLRGEYDFLKYFTYTLDFDSFISFLGAESGPTDQEYLRSELKNKLTVRMTNMIGLSFKHRWYNYYYLRTGERYSNSQFITSLDVITDFKL